MGIVTAQDGAEIYVKDWGSGPPVVLSHGWPLNGDGWEAQQLSLASNGYRAIACDRRGHGRSAQTWHGNEMDTYADDLAAVIDALDLRDATLVGFSTGGGEVARHVRRRGTARLAGGRNGANVSQGIRDAFSCQGLQARHRNAYRRGRRAGLREAHPRRRAEELRRCPARHHRHPQGAARRRPARLSQPPAPEERRMSPTPDTIVLVHGFWVTPRSWERWIDRYEKAGYTVHAPAYPGFEVEVEALNEDPSPIEAVTVPQIIEHLEAIVGAIASPPIIIGHSAGGVFTQILVDHGHGAAGVAINSAPTEGVKRVPLSQVRATFPVLKNPANRHRAVGLTPEQWHYAFANTFSDDESLALYERYHSPASGNVFWSSALANIHPGPDDNHVDYTNDDRAPLLFISGDQDHLMPPSIQQSNAKHYKSNTITEVEEYPGPHLLPAAPGWERVADRALDWALEHARMKPAA